VENRPNIYISCCNRLLRESVARILTKKTDFCVIDLLPSITDTRSEVTPAKADVIVFDSLHRLGETPIVESNRANRRTNKCVLVAMEDDPRSFLAAIRLGALGYVLQDASAAEVVGAIRSVAQGEAVCPPQYVRILYDYFLSHSSGAPDISVRRQFGLTRREQQLLPLIERGMTNKEIANHLHLSEQTVKNHVHRILRKVGVDDRLRVMEAVQTEALLV
jgi:two-component system, NarL family, response regulator DegU